MSNAIKFTKVGGIKLEVLRLESKASATTRLLFKVSDTGIGISPDRIERLFRVFSQVDASITRTYGGSGLGLAICQKLVDLMGGTIRAESQPDQGSIFSFELCLQPLSLLDQSALAETTAAMSQKPEDALPERKLTILLVEDNLTNQKVVKNILRHLGYEADVANDGLEAIAAVENKKYDLIFMDIHMPHMDGLTATYQIRQMESGIHPRIVALTADVLKGAREKYLEIGMNDYASKPIKIELLKKILQEAHAWHDRIV